MFFADEIWEIIKKYLLTDKFKLLSIIRKQRTGFYDLCNIYRIYYGQTYFNRYVNEWRRDWERNKTIPIKEKKKEIIKLLINLCEQYPEHYKYIFNYDIAKKKPLLQPCSQQVAGLST